MDESDFDEYLELGKARKGRELRLAMSPGSAQDIRAGIDLGSEHFRWVETKPNVFELVER